MSDVSKHFVTFYSPGTFVAEQTEKPIDAWDTAMAVEMASDIRERYGAKPYAFRFTTRSRGDTELDSKESARSSFYYLGGKVETLAEVAARNDPSERILRENMRCNGWDRVVTNTNSYRVTLPLFEGDVVLEYPPTPLKQAAE